MRKFILSIFAVTAALAGQTLMTHAQTGTGTTPPASTGVTVAVTTSGYEFTPEIGSLIPPPGGATSAPALPPQVIPASVVLKNNTSGGIVCDLADTGTPGERFEFTLTDSKGKVVWDSLPTVLPPLVVQVTLGAGDAWRGSVSVPLFINGQALPAGKYTLQASLFGSPTFAAVTTVIVHHVIAIN